jgi:hypothetical protein
VTKTIQSPPLRKQWIVRHKYEFSKDDLGFFPRDSLGARSQLETTEYPNRGTPVTLVYSFGEWSGDIAVRKSGVTRPRDHDEMKRLISEASIDDYVRVTEIGHRRYKVELIYSKDGSTIL